MDKETMLRRLKAGEDPLELSIEKWQDIVDGLGHDLGIDNCALCETYQHILGRPWCCNSDTGERCPVAKKTKEPFCVGTPYAEYSSTNTRTAAQKELEFLKSLRPK